MQIITLQGNHLAHYLPSIFLSSDQANKHYIFQLTDEKGNTATHYNNRNE